MGIDIGVRACIEIKVSKIEGKWNPGSLLSLYKTEVFGDGTCLSTSHPGMVCGGCIVYLSIPMGASHMYSSAVRKP